MLLFGQAEQADVDVAGVGDLIAENLRITDASTSRCAAPATGVWVMAPSTARCAATATSTCGATRRGEVEDPAAEHVVFHRGSAARQRLSGASQQGLRAGGAQPSYVGQIGPEADQARPLFILLRKQERSRASTDRAAIHRISRR
ncbi:MAG: hypothetical protein R3F59_02045 [Myxococcota bacterium]